MEKAGNFIRFIIVPASLFFMAWLLMASVAVGFVFMTIGILRHLKNQWVSRTL